MEPENPEKLLIGLRPKNNRRQQMKNEKNKKNEN
jgi:hypothetical protein